MKQILDSEKSLELIDQFVAGEELHHEVVEKIVEARERNDIAEYNRLLEEDGVAARDNIEARAKDIFFYEQTDFMESSQELSMKTKRTTNIILGICLLAVIVAIVVAVLISRSITRRVKIVSNSAEEIAGGNLAIEAMQVNSKDEIGQLAHSFNTMTKNLREIILQVGDTSEQVAASLEQLLASAEETTDATNQVARSITGVASNVEVQARNTEEAAKGVEEISIGVNRIAENTSSVAESSAETAKQANMGMQNIQSVVSQMGAISEANRETNQVVQELENRSTEIGNIIEVITDIADQTNLLALNAAIESARAGEHGKGFAVVADEVRKLAEQSRQSADQISEIVKFIQTDTSRAVQLMENGTNEVTNGLKLAEETGAMFDTILRSIQNASAQTEELSAISEQISASVEQMNASIDEVSNLAQETSANAVEIAAVTEEQLASTEEVSNAANSLANLAEELRIMVNKFKV